MSNQRDVVEGAHAYLFPPRSHGTFFRSLGAQLGRTYQARGSALPDTSNENENFMSTIGELESRLPDGGAAFFGTGYRIIRKSIPRRALRNYRDGFLFIMRMLNKEPDSVVLNKLAILYDALTLAPVKKPDTIHTAIRRRVTLLRLGDWDPLFAELSPCLPGRTVDALPTHADPNVSRAARAELILAKSRSKRGASAALRAPLRPIPPTPGAQTAAFKKLNPVAGSPLVSDATGEVIGTRRPLSPPPGPAPTPIQFTLDDVRSKLGKANKASSGGLSGTDYLTLGSWFHEDDELSQLILKWLNRMAANNVPAAIVDLLTSGRGVVLPKDEKGGLRPIVVGNILLRLLGSMALAKESENIQDFFLKPRPLQFGVGVQGGCEVVAAAITAKLALEPGSVDLSSDLKNAFNSYCRSKMWDVLRENFPSLYSLVLLMYGDEASVLFSEVGVPGATDVPNSVGSRQGCSFGSFLFCLTIHKYLARLADAFPDLLILAYCDDVHFVGDPEMAVQAYHMWESLCTSELQGEFRHDKGLCFSPDPSVSADVLSRFGLPPLMPVSHEGSRVLGAPIGSDDFKRKFAEDRVAEIISDLEVLRFMPSLQMQNGLANGAVIHRVNHLLRNIYGGDRSVYGDVARTYDDAILSSLCRRSSSRPSLRTLAVWVFERGMPLQTARHLLRMSMCRTSLLTFSPPSLPSSQTFLTSRTTTLQQPSLDRLSGPTGHLCDPRRSHQGSARLSFAMLVSLFGVSSIRYLR